MGKGSSPLTRGKRDEGTWDTRAWRLIPAHAGKTRRDRARPHRDGAHPRSRGENLRRRPSCGTQSGSSPLTRGKPLVSEGLHFGKGLIPAHAGKTTRRAPLDSRPRAHPRSRGENNGKSDPLVRARGSSPLTRGKHPLHRVRRNQRRLIPAHAGKTDVVAQMASTMRAHPRSRGENLPGPRNRPPGRGSSPLTRGKRRHRQPRNPGPGLIPAHAGKTERRHARP